MGKKGTNPNSLANLKPAKPGEVRNPQGRKTAGASIREWVNSFAEADLTLAQLRKIAKSPKEGWTRRAAAERIIRTMEAGDLADFAGFLKGENNLEDLRAMGINTEVVKKLKQKTRKVPVAGGEKDDVEEIIEREIELHDRSGEDFDRVINHTDGNPTQRTESVNRTHITVDSAEATIDAILARRLGEPRQN